ncbi:TIGR03084 family metal-binding protein [Streptomyces sp. NPDC050504]|uniref:TIGR03084 family metal-binding protein n=1 Tax=Streptomyces sp. NPDC050504 TaxID=3365618 RepID=UPI0037BB338A
MSELADLLDDLRDESDQLDLILGELEAERWSTGTPADGWTVAYQIAHLAWTDEAALLAVTDPERFNGDLLAVVAAAPDPYALVDDGAAEGAALPPGRLLDRWRTGRTALARALADAPAGHRFPWFGPPMSVGAMATARIMETWAHGQDVVDALGVRRPPSPRLRHVAWIGARARGFAYAAHGLTAPGEEFRLELTLPEGAGTWTYGPPDAAQRVTGPLLDFCLLAVQRAHRDDLSLRAEGSDADQWLDIVQAFAGPAGPGRAPRPQSPRAQSPRPKGA